MSHKIFEEVSKNLTYVPDWYKKGVEYVLLAPTTMNQQKFNFELGASKNNFTWEK